LARVTRKNGVTVKVISNLENQRRKIEITLAHLREQQMEVDTNTEWKDCSAQQQRTALLAELSRWYKLKLRRVDDVLDRATVRRVPRRGTMKTPDTPAGKRF
jgi:hypothetical protein